MNKKHISTEEIKKYNKAFIEFMREPDKEIEDEVTPEDKLSPQAKIDRLLMDD